MGSSIVSGINHGIYSPEAYALGCTGKTVTELDLTASGILLRTDWGVHGDDSVSGRFSEN